MRLTSSLDVKGPCRSPSTAHLYVHRAPGLLRVARSNVHSARCSVRVLHVAMCALHVATCVLHVATAAALCASVELPADASLGCCASWHATHNTTQAQQGSPGADVAGLVYATSARARERNGAESHSHANRCGEPCGRAVRARLIRVSGRVVDSPGTGTHGADGNTRATAQRFALAVNAAAGGAPEVGLLDCNRDELVALVERDLSTPTLRGTMSPRDTVSERRRSRAPTDASQPTQT